MLATCCHDHPPVVGWHNRDQTLTLGAVGEAYGVSAHCRVCIWCAMAGVHAPTASCAGPSRRRHASKAWRSRKPAPLRRTGVGHGCSSGCLPLTWKAVPCVSKARCGSSRRLRRGAHHENPAAPKAGGGPTPHCASPPSSVCMGRFWPLTFRRAPSGVIVPHALAPVPVRGKPSSVWSRPPHGAAARPHPAHPGPSKARPKEQPLEMMAPT